VHAAASEFVANRAKADDAVASGTDLAIGTVLAEPELKSVDGQRRAGDVCPGGISPLIVHYECGRLASGEPL
jgi:hypothetical protein